MLRMYVVQQCFGLSDEGTEDAVYDSRAIRGFIGIDWAVSRHRMPLPCCDFAACWKPIS